MSNVPQSILEGREAIGPWNYSARVPEGASSASYAFLPLAAAVLFGGLGVFLGDDVAHRVPFWSNASVWIAVMLSAACLLLSASMFLGRWVWTAPQMGMFGLAVFSSLFWAFQGASLFAFLLYSHAPLFAKAGVLIAFVVWHGWWVVQTATRCMSIWANATTREKVWVPYDCATVYRQFAAKSAMDEAGVIWHPGTMGILLPFTLCAPLYLYRQEVIAYLDVPWVPATLFLIGMPIFVVCTTALTAAVVAMLIIPARIVASTGKPVLVDMMTP
jgi:hypothetical protein